MQVTRSSCTLMCIGLGSCIGLVLYDRIATTGGMSHIMMPESGKSRKSERLNEKRAKYADIAVGEMVRKMERLSADKCNIKAYVFGGANMFSNIFPNSGISNLGKRNIDMVKSELARENIHIAVDETGGTTGRTVIFNMGNPSIEMRTIRGENKRWEL